MTTLESCLIHDGRPGSVNIVCGGVGLEWRKDCFLICTHDQRQVITQRRSGCDGISFDDYAINISRQLLQPCWQMSTTPDSDHRIASDCNCKWVDTNGNMFLQTRDTSDDDSHPNRGKQTTDACQFPVTRSQPLHYLSTAPQSYNCTHRWLNFLISCCRCLADVVDRNRVNFSGDRLSLIAGTPPGRPLEEDTMRTARQPERGCSVSMARVNQSICGTHSSMPAVHPIPSSAAAAMRSETGSNCCMRCREDSWLAPRVHRHGVRYPSWRTACSGNGCLHGELPEQVHVHFSPTYCSSRSTKTMCTRSQ